MFRLGLLLSFFLLLQGCLNVATTGAGMVYNRHSLQKNIHDQYISMQAYKALSVDDKQFADSNISISTFNKRVLLAGEVRRPWQKIKAEEIVKQIPNVERVYNVLPISNPSSTLTRISDIWLTTKIKAKLLASDDIDGSQVKVVTENGTVYLMGTLQKYEADAAVDLASTTDGVESVVKIFSYVKIVG